MRTKFDTEVFDHMADQAKRLAENSARLRADAAKTREAIQAVARQLDSVDLGRILTGMRQFASLARNPAGA